MEALPIPSESYKLGFIGAGKMAESIARGNRRQPFDSLGIPLLPRNDDVVEDSDIVIFSVKPQLVKDVILQLSPLLSRKKLLVSIAAGVKLKDLQDWAGHSRFIRAMPNTPSAVGVAASEPRHRPRSI